MIEVHRMLDVFAILSLAIVAAQLDVSLFRLGITLVLYVVCSEWVFRFFESLEDD